MSMHDCDSEMDFQSLNQRQNNVLSCSQDLEHQWEAVAEEWISNLPVGHILTTAEVEAWVESHRSSLPDEINSMSASEIYDRIISIQNGLELLNQDVEMNEDDIPHARFQRSDQWRPVYSWLESLNKDEVVKSNEISEWLSGNPNITKELSLRHSRYHLMHYIKKCHFKILKRKEKWKILQNSLKIKKPEMVKQQTSFPGSFVENFPKDEDAFIAKRKEDLRKFEILLDLEKQLGAIFESSNK